MKKITQFPDALTHLTVNSKYQWNLNHLPIHLKELHLCSNVNVDNWPPNLETVHFYGRFNQSLKCIPNTVRDLKLGEYDCDILQDDFPTSLQTLNLGDATHFKFTHFPSTLTSLHLGSHYNEKIHAFPNSLINLYLEHYNYESLDDILPSGLKELSLGYGYTHKLRHLPPCLTSLYVGWSYNHVLLDKSLFPTTLLRLYVDKYGQNHDYLTQNDVPDGCAIYHL